VADYETETSNSSEDNTDDDDYNGPDPLENSDEDSCLTFNLFKSLPHTFVSCFKHANTVASIFMVSNMSNWIA